VRNKQTDLERGKASRPAAKGPLGSKAPRQQPGRLRAFALLGVAGAMLAGLVGLGVTLFRSSEPPPPEALGPGPEDGHGKLSTRFRSRSLPKFQTVEMPAPPAPPPLPPPALTPPPIEPPPPPPPNPQAELRERASKDGYIFRVAGENAVYMVQNGTKFHIKSPEDLRALGYTWDRVEVVPPGSLGFLRDKPPEKTLMRERDHREVYYYENGQKRWVTSEEMLQKMGHSWNDVKVVPSGALGAEATGSPIQ
jgi:hypothetical protein